MNFVTALFILVPPILTAAAAVFLLSMATVGSGIKCMEYHTSLIAMLSHRPPQWSATGARFVFHHGGQVYSTDSWGRDLRLVSLPRPAEEQEEGELAPPPNAYLLTDGAHDLSPGGTHVAYTPRQKEEEERSPRACGTPDEDVGDWDIMVA